MCCDFDFVSSIKNVLRQFRKHAPTNYENKVKHMNVFAYFENIHFLICFVRSPPFIFLNNVSKKSNTQMGKSASRTGITGKSCPGITGKTFTGSTTEDSDFLMCVPEPPFQFPTACSTMSRQQSTSELHWI